MTLDRKLLSVQTVRENIAILEECEEPEDAGYYLQLEHEKFVLSALEKQIPKKAHFHHSQEKGFCPNCLSVEDTSANYCRCCGQLLDFDSDHPTEKGGVE